MKAFCAHCGLPFSVARAAPSKAAYCCSGCALAARLAPDAQDDAGGAAPGRAVMLAGAVGLSFAFFNQALFWMFSLLLARRAGAEDAATAQRLVFASLATGGAAWLGLGVLQARVAGRRPADLLVSVATFAVLAGAFFTVRAEPALAANAALGAWALRGLAKRKVPGKSGARTG